MGRVLALLAVAGAVLAAPAAADPPRISHFNVEYTVPIAGICSFPITLHAVEEHTTIAQFRDVPEGLHPSLWVLYQSWGKHFASFRDTWSNPLTGRSVEATGAGPLNRRDFDDHLTIGPDGKLDGYFTADDQYAGVYIGTAPGWGPLIHFAGTSRFHHTSVIVDGVRVSRSDVLYFNVGPSDFEPGFCEYLAGA